MSRPIISDDFEDKFFTKVTGKGNSQDTATRYLRQTSAFEDWLQANRGKGLLDVDTPDLRVHIEEMQGTGGQNDGYAASTIKQRRAGISAFYNIANEIEEDYDVVEGVPPNPSDEYDSSWNYGETKISEGVEAEEGIYYLTPEEVTEVEKNVPAPKLRNTLVVRMLFNLGLRREELAQVTLSAIDWEANTIHIPAMKSPKPRKVPYNENYVGKMLRRWVEDGHREATFGYRELNSSYLFPTDSTEHISGYTINEIVKKAVENAGFQKTISEYIDGRSISQYTAHSLRHSYAVQAIKSGIDVRSLNDLLGHSDEKLDTTMTYLKIAESDYIEEGKQFKPHG